MKLSAEAYASLDSMEGIELARPRIGTPARATLWTRLGLIAALCIAAASWAVHLLFPPVSAAILAIVLGTLVRNGISLPAALIEDCKGLVKRVIPITIVLTGASVNLTEVARVGAPCSLESPQLWRWMSSHSGSTSAMSIGNVKAGKVSRHWRSLEGCWRSGSLDALSGVVSLRN
jgi:hypothetical protein